VSNKQTGYLGSRATLLMTAGQALLRSLHRQPQQRVRLFQQLCLIQGAFACTFVLWKIFLFGDRVAPSWRSLQTLALRMCLS
jgi:hypothetical protein